ncbi:hypothetical protein DPMN_049089, partial [Dreissena polymorpha]
MNPSWICVAVVCMVTVGMSVGVCGCYHDYQPVCGVDGKTYGNQCAISFTNVEKAYDGECRNPPCLCSSTIPSPVCGNDGLTYKNVCLMTCNGATEAHPGSCYTWFEILQYKSTETEFLLQKRHVNFDDGGCPASSVIGTRASRLGDQGSSPVPDSMYVTSQANENGTSSGEKVRYSKEQYSGAFWVITLTSNHAAWAVEFLLQVQRVGVYGSRTRWRKL